MRGRQRRYSASCQQPESLSRQLDPRRRPQKLLLGAALLLAALLLHPAIVEGIPWDASQVPVIEDLRKAMTVSGQVVAFKGWNAGDDCTTAQVLTCDGQGMVTSINLIYNTARYYGSIPPSIGTLLQLTSFVLQHTRFDKSLPGSLSSLVKLVRLDLLDNFFVGTIPSFNSLTALTYLDLSDNMFNGTVPSFGSLTALTYLNMSYNGLSGSLPDCFESLSNLASLQLRRNKFTKEIPASISSLVKLSALDLSANSFTGTVPPFSSLTALTYLGMGGNYGLSGSIPESVSLLKQLVELELLYVKLDGSVPSGLFALPRITRIVIASIYQLSCTIPQSISSLTNLVELNLPYISLTAVIPSELFTLASLTRLKIGGRFEQFGSIPESISHLTNLVEIDLSHATFTGGIPAGLFNLSQLTSIVFNDAHLSESLPANLSKMAQLKHLDLRYNHFFGPFPDIKGLSQLTYLDIGHNFFAGDIPITDDMTDLRFLNLEFNYFKSGFIEDYICYQADVMVTSNCFVLDVPCQLNDWQMGDCSDFCGMNAYNGLSPCTGHGYCYGENLNAPWVQQSVMQCQCANNYTYGSTNASCISPLESSQTNVLDGLLKLWGASPNITWQTLLQFAETEDNFIVRLDFSYMGLSETIPSILTKLARLTHLNLSMNAFSGNVPECLSSLVRMQELDLSYNELSGSIPSSFRSLRYLKTLNVSNNYLYSGTLPSATCTSTTLTALSLENNCFPPSAVPCSHAHCREINCGLTVPCISVESLEIDCTVTIAFDSVECAETDCTITIPSGSVQCAATDCYINIPSDSAECAETDCSISVPSDSVECMGTDCTITISSNSVEWGELDCAITFPCTSVVSLKSKFAITIPYSSVDSLGSHFTIPSDSVDCVDDNCAITVPYGSVDFPEKTCTITIPFDSAVCENNNCEIAIPWDSTLENNCTGHISCITQRPPEDCSAFCGLSPPFDTPCAGLGHCHWEWGENDASTAMCACKEGYNTGKESTTCVPLLSQTEWAVLESLTAAWGGFDGNGTWKSGIPCELMNNVICDDANQIVALDVSWQGIWGNIPDAITGLESLSVLNLTGNYFTGTLPKALGSLLSLVSLSVSNNYFYADTLPKTMCNASALDMIAISLQGNCFNSSAMPCDLTHTQRQNCSAFCGLSPPSTVPCDGHGYCHLVDGNATCACKKGYGHGDNSSTCVNVLPKSEWLALDALRVAWGGFNGSGTWNESFSCVQMLHVKCNEYNQIEKLNVSGLNISGFIPSSIEGLSHLTLLNVSNNAIAGPIPDSISCLTKLRILDLSHNQLSGALPSGLNSLLGLNSSLGVNNSQGLSPKGLLALNVSHNYLYSSSLNATTCNSSAQLLSLHNNCFNSSAMPCNLTHTQRPREKCSAFCHLSPPSTPPCPGHGYCYWKGGEGLGNATCACGSDSNRGGTLETCDGLPPDLEWAALEALTKAWGGFNGNGTWTSVSACAQMKHITCDADNHIISLLSNGSQVVGSIPALIGNLIHLTALNLTGSQFRGSLPTTIGRLTNLVQWDFHTNSFTGKIPKSISALQRLEILEFGDNMFKGQIPDGVCNMTKLTKLNISHNTFAGSIPDCLSNLTKLSILDMNDNRMTGQLLPNLKALKKLTYMDLSNNRFSGSLPSRLTSLKALRTLKLDNNKLSGALAPLPKNVRFSARYNYLSRANSVTCKKGYLENNCFLDKKRVCPKLPRRPMNECAPFCGLSSKMHPCVGRGSCVLDGVDETPTCVCDGGYANGEIPFTCIPEEQSYPQTDMIIIESTFTLTNRTSTLPGEYFYEVPFRLFSYETIGNDCGRQFYFNVSFAFMMLPKLATGGGGLAFVVSSTKKRGNGSGVGYAGMDKRSMAVEFDTWLDKQDKDTSANHVGVNLKGSPFSVKTANVSKDLNNGRMYFAWVDYGPGESESLRVFVNASNTKPDNPSLSMNLSLCDLLQPTPKKNSYYFGFVAASLPRHEQEHLVATTTIDIGFTLPPALPEDGRATGLVLDVDTFNPTIASPFTRYVSVGYSPAQDGQDSWNIPTLSTWTLDSTWEAPDQGDCSDCWAYAVVASIEAAYGIATNNKMYPSLSINSLFEVTRMASCESGSPTLAFQKLVASKKGLRNTSSWDSSPSSLASVRSPSSSLVAWLFKAVWHSPSLGKAALPRRHRAAAAVAETGNYIVSGFERTAFKGYFGLMLAVRRQPVVVHIEASAASFVNYNGSFRYDEPDCYTGNLNHVVLVTGYLLMGTDKNRPRTLSPFWRIRNSWGTEWGAEGYIHMGIAPGEGICGINVLPGIYPIIRNSDDPCMRESFITGNGDAVMNPCGSYECIETADGASNTCGCKPPFVEALNNDGSRSCAYVDVCSASMQNPCEVGSCINDGQGRYTCICPSTHMLDTTIDGFPTCTRGFGTATTLMVAGSNWHCADVHSLFGLTLDEFKHNNVKIDCSDRLPWNQPLNMAKANVDACSAFYYTLPSDTCSSIETFLKLSGSLEKLNPGIQCLSLDASRSLCIERNSTALGPVRKCHKTAIITKMDDCTNAGNALGSGITMVDLYRMNPGLVCDPAKGLKGDASGSMKVEVCVDAEYDNYSMGKCSVGKLKYFKADTPCVSLLAREFKGKRADFRALNKRECATTIGGKPQEHVALCIPS
ncbi:hypothetical protein CLOM_g23103 [Closterium sp. NIES-68]|nr:hypothetical protein CLOM_g23103 [Closterium sp. NIES-68]